MTEHEDKIRPLNALIDGELDAANVIAVEEHLKTCPECARTFAELRRVRDILDESGLRHSAPEPFVRRLRIVLEEARTEKVRRKPAARTRMRWSLWGPSGALATLGLAACLFASLQTTQTPLTDELVSDHVRSLLADHLTDIPTSDNHVVKPWFDGKVPFAPPVIDFKENGFPLVGGRLDLVQGRRVVALIYRRRLHVINVFIWPDSGMDQILQDKNSSGYNLVHWTSDGLNYWAVSDLDTTEIREIRDLYITVTSAKK